MCTLENTEHSCLHCACSWLLARPCCCRWELVQSCATASPLGPCWSGRGRAGIKTFAQLHYFSFLMNQLLHSLELISDMQSMFGDAQSREYNTSHLKNQLRNYIKWAFKQVSVGTEYRVLYSPFRNCQTSLTCVTISWLQGASAGRRSGALSTTWWASTRSWSGPWSVDI